MNIFKKLQQWFKTITKTTKTNTQNDKINVLLEMAYNVIYPDSLMESLLMAVAIDTLEPATASLSDVRLYSLYDREDHSFVGSCYALKRGGRFYGNIVGSTQVISFTLDAFRMKETTKLYIPLKCEKEKKMVFEGTYDQKLGNLTIFSLKWINEEGGTEQVLHEFIGGVTFKQAYYVYRKFDKFH